MFPVAAAAFDAAADATAAATAATVAAAVASRRAALAAMARCRCSRWRSALYCFLAMNYGCAPRLHLAEVPQIPLARRALRAPQLRVLAPFGMPRRPRRHHLLLLAHRQTAASTGAGAAAASLHDRQRVVDAVDTLNQRHGQLRRRVAPAAGPSSSALHTHRWLRGIKPYTVRLLAPYIAQHCPEHPACGR